MSGQAGLNGKDAIIEAIAQMSVLELSELVKALEEKFAIKAAIPVGAGVPGVAAGGGEGAAADTEVQTEFTAILAAAGDKKIQVIKVIREITNLGLKEAKDLVEGAPKPIKGGLNKEQAEEIKKKLTEQGATVEIK